MARITHKFFPANYEGDGPYINDGALTGRSSSKAVFTDSLSGDKIMFEGKGLTYDHGMFAGGTITKLAVVDEDGVKYQLVEGMSLKAGRLEDVSITGQIAGIGEWVYQSDARMIGTGLSDTMFAGGGRGLLLGRGGNDSLYGGTGNDTLVGGAGSDVFAFDEQDGKDTIQDFDADGSDGSQDLIQADYARVELISRSGKNTIVDFGDGDRLTLQNVRPSEIDDTDFML